MSKFMVLLYANESAMPKPGTSEFDAQNAAYGLKRPSHQHGGAVDWLLRSGLSESK